MTTRPQNDAARVQGEGRARAWGWRLVPFLVWLWLCFPLLAGWEMVGFRDAPNWYQPAWEWVDGQAWHWDAAPWNPWDGAGAPIAADPTIALFYPPRWLMRLPVGTHVWRFSLFLALHVLLACATAGVLARRLGCKPAGCAVAAMAYGLGGTVLFQVTNPIYLVGAAWLPLALAGAWSISRPETEDREWRREFLLASAALAMMVLGGDVQLAYVGLLIAAMTCWWNWLKARTRNRTPVQHSGSMPNVRTRRSGIAPAALDPLTPTPLPPLKAAGGEGPELDSGGRWRLLWAPVALGLAVGLLSLAQIWPSAEFARFSQRFSESHPQTIYDVAGAMFREGWSAASRDAAALIADPPPGTHAEQVYQFSQTPWSLLELFVPGFSGYPWPLNTRWLDGLPGADRMWNVSLYAGALTMLLAGLAVFRRRDSQDRFLFWIGVFGVLGSLGWFGAGWLLREVMAATGKDQALAWLGRPAGGVYWLLATLAPGMSGFRYPAKLFVFAALAVALLAGRSICCLHWPRNLVVLRWSSIALGLIWLLLATSDLGESALQAACKASPDGGELGPIIGPVEWAVASSELEWATRWIGTLHVFLGLVTFFRWKYRDGGMATVCCLLLALDLLMWQSRIMPRTKHVAPSAAKTDQEHENTLMRAAGFRVMLSSDLMTELRGSYDWRDRLLSPGLKNWNTINQWFAMPRHHWLAECVRLDGPQAMQPAPQWLPVLGTVHYERIARRGDLLEQSDGVEWWKSSDWSSPAKRRELGKSRNRRFVPRVVLYPGVNDCSLPWEVRIGPDGQDEASVALLPRPSSPVESHRFDPEQGRIALLVVENQPGSIGLDLLAGSPGLLCFPEGWCGGWSCQIKSEPDGESPAFWRVLRPVNDRDWQFNLPAGVTGIQLRFCPVSWWLGVPACFTTWVFWLVLLGKTSISGGGMNSVKTPQVDQLGNAGLNQS